MDDGSSRDDSTTLVVDAVLSTMCCTSGRSSSHLSKLILMLRELVYDDVSIILFIDLKILFI